MSYKPLKATGILLLLLMLLSPIFTPSLLQAQSDPSAQQAERESLDLNTIATLSVAVVFQSFGYIGTYADLLGTGVYDAARVTEMLRETTVYLQNSRDQLRLFQASAMGLSTGDKKYLAEVVTIMDLLIAEADSLKAFALNHNQADLKKYEANKTRAWSHLSKLLGTS
ncbi:MAG: hypothetical protein LBE27_04495 [Deltaproteobacteria bacterium]|jgi:hypothetical protein|nr:hypothetical protein [Deltaproteobacteria bacterium]